MFTNHLRGRVATLVAGVAATSLLTVAAGTAGTASAVTPGAAAPSAAVIAMAVGRLHATLTRANGKVVGTDSKTVTLPVRSADGAPVGKATAARAGDCAILHLVLGPLDLNLLGLKVHLDKVVLDVDAAPGAGNLLGNLLCAVAGLLDDTGVLTQVKQILNSILAILKL
jgi:hypothetical protein